MEDKIKQRIEQLKAERDTFVTQANQQIAAFNGAIQALELLLSDDSSNSVVEQSSRDRSA